MTRGRNQHPKVKNEFIHLGESIDFETFDAEDVRNLFDEDEETNIQKIKNEFILMGEAIGFETFDEGGCSKFIRCRCTK